MALHAPATEFVFRYARDDERARVELARSSLRTSALMTIGVGILIPGAVAAAATVWVFAAYPGSFLTRVLVGVLEIAGIGLAFTLPLFLTSSGRVLALHRAVTRDAALGFRVVRVRGDVIWDRRRRALVARAGGRRLASPFFTRLEAIPLFWDHFDQLAPRSYDFEMLEASGFVLTASPTSSAERDGHDNGPGNVALREAFRIGLVDLEANRRGLATARQRRRVLLSSLWVLLLLIPLSIAIAFGIGAVIASPHLGAGVGLLVAIVLALFLARLTFRIVVDVARGEVVSAAGVVHLEHGKTEDSAIVGGMEFMIDDHQARVLQPNVRYRVYAFKHSRQAASAELADGPESDFANDLQARR